MCGQHYSKDVDNHMFMFIIIINDSVSKVWRQQSVAAMTYRQTLYTHEWTDWQWQWCTRDDYSSSAAAAAAHWSPSSQKHQSVTVSHSLLTHATRFPNTVKHLSHMLDTAADFVPNMTYNVFGGTLNPTLLLLLLLTKWSCQWRKQGPIGPNCTCTESFWLEIWSFHVANWLYCVRLFHSIRIIVWMYNKTPILEFEIWFSIRSRLK